MLYYCKWQKLKAREKFRGLLDFYPNTGKTFTVFAYGKVAKESHWSHYSGKLSRHIKTVLLSFTV